MFLPKLDCALACQNPRKGAMPEPPANIATGPVIVTGSWKLRGRDIPMRYSSSSNISGEMDGSGLRHPLLTPYRTLEEIPVSKTEASRYSLRETVRSMTLGSSSLE